MEPHIHAASTNLHASIFRLSPPQHPSGVVAEIKRLIVFEDIDFDIPRHTGSADVVHLSVNGVSRLQVFEKAFP